MNLFKFTSLISTVLDDKNNKQNAEVLKQPQYSIWILANEFVPCMYSLNNPEFEFLNCIELTSLKIEDFSSIIRSNFNWDFVYGNWYKGYGYNNQMRPLDACCLNS